MVAATARPAPPTTETLTARISSTRAHLLVSVDAATWRGSQVVSTVNLYRRWAPPQDLNQREAVEVLREALLAILEPFTSPG